jgi:hypothetical protein
MHSNLKIAKNLDNIDDIKEKQETKYTFVNNLENGIDIMIHYYGFDEKNTKYFKICNEELIGKEYFILNDVGYQIIYYDTIQENTNLFPKENLPIYLLKCHQIIFLIKNIGNINYDNFELFIQNMYSNHKFDNLNLDDSSNFIELDWKINKNDEDNLLRIEKNLGMFGVAYYDGKYNSVYSYLKEYSEKNSIIYDLQFNINKDFYDNVIYEQKNIGIFSFYDFSEIKIKKFINLDADNKYKNQALVNFLSCYTIDRFFDIMDNFDVVSDDIFIKLQNQSDNTHKHIFIGDAVENLSFYCDCKITKIQLYIYNNEDKNIVNIYDMPFEKTQFGYKIYKEDVYFSFVSQKCQIVVYSDNNSPIFIKYNICCFERKFRLTIAYERYHKKMIIISKYDEKDYLSYKEKYMENLIQDEKIHELNNNISINDDTNIIL